MNDHVLEQLPLWIGGDLGPADMAAVDAHLSRCPACQQEAAHLRRSQAWLRETQEPPFEAGDRARLRRNVLAQIRQEPLPSPIQRFRPRPAWLAACAAALLLAVLTWHRDTPVRLPVPDAAPPTVNPVPSPPDPPPHQTTQAALRPPRAKPVEAAPVPEAPARIEFQTADPTVRIIWLAQARPLPEAIPPTQEVP
jgi:hypothetical protein